MDGSEDVVEVSTIETVVDRLSLSADDRTIITVTIIAATPPISAATTREDKDEDEASDPAESSRRSFIPPRVCLDAGGHRNVRENNAPQRR